MKKDKKQPAPKKIRTGSIARRINAAQAWRRFGRGILLSVVCTAVLLMAWCLLVEWAHYGGISNVSGREFSGTFVWQDNIEGLLNQFSEDTTMFSFREYIRENNLIAFRPATPFDGIEYCFRIRHTDAHFSGYRYDASGILTICSAVVLLSFVFQFMTLLTSLFGGSRIIRKYLKPIDEIALIADRLSAESRSASPEEVRLNLDSLEDAINAIEDSDTRLSVNDTELGALEAALNNMLKRLDEGKRKQIRFVDDASHELRTPIAVIQGYIQLLDRWGKEDPKVRDEAIEAIKAEADHMKTLIDQLLFLSRGEMDRHVLEIVPVDVCEVLTEIRDESVMLDENAAEHHEFLLSLPETESDGEFRYEELMVRADLAMLKQAVRILRDNAVKYTPADGRITFRAYQRAVVSTNGQSRQTVCIEISDTGIGIRAKELPRIFDRFYRGENVRANSVSGSGLGLSIAKWIVEEHGGIMEAISSEGFGTKITIVLDEDVSRETK